MKFCAPIYTSAKPHLRSARTLDVTPVRPGREEAVLIVGIKKRIRKLEVRP